MLIKKTNPFFYKIKIDLSLLLITIFISIYSILVIWSSSNKSFLILEKKILQILLGIIAMFFAAQISCKIYKKMSYFIYFIFIILLILVALDGRIINGAKRWISFFGLFNIQPAEISKLSVTLMLSSFICNKKLPLLINNTIISFFLILAPSILIGIQPDLGTALLVFISGLFILCLTSMKQHIIILLMMSILFTPILWFFLMYDYQRIRIINFLNTSDYLGSGYNILQSKIAIGSGGLYGKGWLLGSQANLGFLPERNTDFIFAVLAEEFGFIGVTILFLMYLLLMLRIMYIAINAKSIFGHIFSSSIMFIIFIYVIVNISMVSGIIPIVGVPLPFFSYGGSSTVILMFCIGVVISIKYN